MRKATIKMTISPKAIQIQSNPDKNPNDILYNKRKHKLNCMQNYKNPKLPKQF